ncbi:rhoGAP domain-containing protein [Ditylenchus destructor]|uniref:RhoGAP domain-containing protein n=1 Tax=Ditylenchus destructor TaxID=166010 RepID=A0AAD4MSB6_9BILA|nr:rhoGAP domain-containing protein [Ditylenchus destructor]
MNWSSSLSCFAILYLLAAFVSNPSVAVKGDNKKPLSRKASAIDLLTQKLSLGGSNEEQTPPTLEQDYQEFNLEADSRNAQKFSRLVKEALDWAECHGSGIATDGLFRSNGSWDGIVKQTLLDYIKHTKEPHTHRFNFARDGMTAIDAAATVRRLLILKKPFFVDSLLESIEEILNIKNESDVSKKEKVIEEAIKDKEKLNNIKGIISMHVPHYKIRLFRHIAATLRKMVECQDGNGGLPKVEYNALTVLWAPTMFPATKDSNIIDVNKIKTRIQPMLTKFFEHYDKIFERLPNEPADEEPYCRNSYKCNATVGIAL